MLNDWYALGMVQYRKWQVYDLAWEGPTTTASTPTMPISLDNYIVSGAPFGGPIAMIPDHKRTNTSNESTLVKNKLLIFTSAGVHLAEIDWNERPVIGMGWTDQENLVVVSEHGVAKIYDLHGRLITDFHLLDMNDITPVQECHFWGNGVAAITANMMIKVAEVSFNPINSNS